MTLRGGHGRAPGATDSRQGKARGEAYRTQAVSGVKGVLLIGLFAIALFASVAFLADPNLRVWARRRVRRLQDLEAEKNSYEHRRNVHRSQRVDRQPESLKNCWHSASVRSRTPPASSDIRRSISR